MADSKQDERNRGRARRAVQRASDTKTRGGGVPLAALAPEVLRMTEMGMTVPEIAKALRRSERYVRKLKQYAREHAEGSLFIEVPDPKDWEDIEPWAREMLEPTADAFEKFFVYFSEYEYLPAHLKEAVADALEFNRVMVNMPPRHAKSEVFSVWLPIWFVCRNRNIQVLLLSRTETLAQKFAYEISIHLMQNQRLIEAYGRFKPETTDWPWQPGSGRLMVAGRTRLAKPGDMTLQIRGGKQQILGMEADVVVLDDVDDMETAASETERNRLQNRVDGEALSRLTPTGRAMCVGQRVHMYDIYSHLEAKKHRQTGEPVWKVHKMRAIQKWPTEEDPEALVLWPEFWTFDRLMDSYSDQGETLFETMYQQNPMPLGDRIVRPEWIYGNGTTHMGCLDQDRPAYHGVMTRLAHLPISRVVSIDPSPKQWTGVCVADVVYTDSGFLASVLELTHEKGMGLRDLVEEIDRCLKQYAPVDYLIFETSTFSHWLFEDPYFQTLKGLVRVIPHITSAKTKGDPELGIRSLAIEFEKGLIRLPYGDPEAKAMTDSFIEDELFTYPQGRVDDRLDALWFIKARWRSLRPLKSMPTEVRGMPMKKGSVWDRMYDKDSADRKRLRGMRRARA